MSIITFLTLLAIVRGQDIHFSQVDADPMLLNPAYAGFFNGTGRFGMIYRNQWATVSFPYETFAVTGEMAVWRSPSARNGLSIGASFFSDHAGTLHYGTTSAHLSAAYFFPLSHKGNHYLSLGIEGGYAQSGFDPSALDMEDASETIETHQISYPLLCVGAAWYCQMTGDLHTKVGFSVRNLNRPNISFQHESGTWLERRYSLFARAEWRCWQSMSLMPVALVQMQGEYRELLYGTDIKWYISEGGAHEVGLRTGLAMRHNDALIANLMLEYDAFLMTICYDANISDLAVASRYFGAFEVGLVYRMSKGKRKTKSIKCPMY